jgi:hypothetical protein
MGSRSGSHHQTDVESLARKSSSRMNLRLDGTWRSERTLVWLLGRPRMARANKDEPAYIDVIFFQIKGQAIQHLLPTWLILIAGLARGYGIPAVCLVTGPSGFVTARRRTTCPSWPARRTGSRCTSQRYGVSCRAGWRYDISTNGSRIRGDAGGRARWRDEERRGEMVQELQTAGWRLWR